MSNEQSNTSLLHSFTTFQQYQCVNLNCNMIEEASLHSPLNLPHSSLCYATLSKDYSCQTSNGKQIQDFHHLSRFRFGLANPQRNFKEEADHIATTYFTTSYVCLLQHPHTM